MHQQMKIAQPLHWISVASRAARALPGHLRRHELYWELQDGDPDVKGRSTRYRRSRHPARRVGRVYGVRRAPGSGARLGGWLKTTDVREWRGTRCGRCRPTTTQVQQWWRNLRNQVVPGHVDPQRSRAGHKTKGDFWGRLEVVSRGPANEGVRPGPAPKRARLAVGPLSRSGAGRPELHRPGVGGSTSCSRWGVVDLRP